MTPRAFWTYPELRILAQHYPAGGVRACLPLLRRRSKTAIYAAATELGLKRDGRKPGSGRRQQGNANGLRATIAIVDELGGNA
ncbi:hypothetical protein [Sphingomonas sp. PR090111-T3T-6A]|uniref:hypothetical protein n=1 Tax=Sphingomonas sp. PR090111-T3T-6A TaxID=685778 RepID=UPI0003735567|nr:hypothetical protein [Sphingomonas sp. PR090111-T3T-6A]